jgi:hypothetical protein
MLPFALTIFLSAFLLFQIQPVVGKYILPGYGGGAGVWTACLLFFQIVLLLGYVYAHLLRSCSLRHQRWIHLGLLALSLLSLPVRPGPPALEASPTAGILALLLESVGLPFLLVCSSAPLLQSWFAAARPGRSPYRLYALSNLGALLALLSYPVLVEPHLSRDAQVWVWSAAYVVFALLTLWCLLIGRRPAGAAETGGHRRARARAGDEARHRQVARPRRRCLRHAAGHHQSADPGGAGGALPLGAAALDLPALVHPLL